MDGLLLLLGIYFIQFELFIYGILRIRCLLHSSNNLGSLIIMYSEVTKSFSSILHGHPVAVQSELQGG